MLGGLRPASQRPWKGVNMDLSHKRNSRAVKIASLHPSCPIRPTGNR